MLGDSTVISPSPLEGLRTFKVNGNRLEKFGEALAFAQLKNIEELDLSDNALRSIDWMRLTQYEKLVRLNLRRNLLQYIPEQALETFHALRELYLAENPFHCNCRLRWLREFYDTAVDKGLDFSDVRCASPRPGAMSSIRSSEFVCIAPRKPVITLRFLHDDVYAINCTAVGDPAPKLTFLLANGRKVITPPSEDLSRDVTASPEILTVGGGVVKCEAENSEGVSTSSVLMPKPGKILC